MLAQVTNYLPGEFIHTMGDAHIYKNHLVQVREQLTRSPKPLPKMRLNPEVMDIFDFTYEDFNLIDYNPAPYIAAKVAV